MKILLYRSHRGDPISYEIDALERGHYCHAALLIESPDIIQAVKAKWGVKYPLGAPGHLIIESYYPCVRPRVLVPGELAAIDVFTVTCLKPGDDEAIEQWCLDHIEIVTYSVKDLFLFLAPVRAILGEPTTVQCQHSMFCSMFDFEAVRSRGIMLLRAHSYDMAPEYLSWSPLMTQGAPLQ